MDAFDTVNAVYEGFVSGPYPARSAVGVSDLTMEFAVGIGIIAARWARLPATATKRVLTVLRFEGGVRLWGRVPTVRVQYQ